MTSHLFTYVDKEAPAESIWIVFKMVLHGRESLSVGHTVALCRLITNGPRAETMDVKKLINQAAEKWKSHNGLEFTTKNWQISFISNVISRLKGGNDCAEDSDAD